MTRDVIALTERMPDVRSILAGMLAAGPGLRVATVADGAVVQLCDDGGRPLVSIEAPILVQVPGEAIRLLGPDAAGVGPPAWWVEARASTAVGDAEWLARTFAGRLTERLGGVLWPPGEVAAEPPSGIRGGPPPERANSPAPAAAQPAVDVLTDRVAVVLQDRPVVPMTSWLSDALRSCTASDRGLQIVTPVGSRLSMPLRSALPGPPSRWVVRDPAGGYYDGLSGAVLHWRDGTFAPVGGDRGGNGDGGTPVAAAFGDTAGHGECQLVVSFGTRQPPSEHAGLGGALEAAFQALAGRPPAGWGTAEPAGLPWRRREITELCRRRAPGGTWLVAVGGPGRPAIATMRVARTSAGVEEDVTLVVGYPAGAEPPVGRLPELAADLVTEHGLGSMLVQRRAGRSDLTVPARWEGMPVPVGYALGPEGVGEVGLEHARRPPELAARGIGSATRPGLWYALGDGRSAAGWTALDRLMRHLRPPAD